MNEWRIYTRFYPEKPTPKAGKSNKMTSSETLVPTETRIQSMPSV